MREITKTQIAAIHVILRDHGLTAEKPRIISEISGGRTESTRCLYFEEARQWINAMNGLKKPEPDPRQKMVNSILAMAHEIKLIEKESAVTSSGIKQKNNYRHLNEWMLKYSYLKKPLNEYKYAELPTLVTQFKSFYFSRIKQRS